MDTWDLSNTQKILPDRIIESSKLYPKVSQAVAHTLMTSFLEIFGLSDYLPTIVECVPQPSTLPKSSELRSRTYVASLLPEQKKKKKK